MEWWRLDEGAHAGPEHLDPAHLAGYERKAGYDPTPDVDVLRSHGIGGDSVVVDLAGLPAEFSTFSWLFGPMLERTGFSILEREDVIGFYAAYTCRN